MRKVRRNTGACGVDGITIGRAEQNRQSRRLALKERLNKGTYQPTPVKRVWIGKPRNVEKRPVRIPTDTDRVVQAAKRAVINVGLFCLLGARETEIASLHNRVNYLYPAAPAFLAVPFSALYHRCGAGRSGPVAF